MMKSVRLIMKNLFMNRERLRNVQFMYECIFLTILILDLIFSSMLCYKVSITYSMSSKIWNIVPMILFWIFLIAYCYIIKSWRYSEHTEFYRDAAIRLLTSEHRLALVIWESIISVCGILIIFGSVLFIFGFVPNLPVNIELKYIITSLLCVDCIVLYVLGCHYVTLQSFMSLKRLNLYKLSYEELIKKMDSMDLE